MKPEKNSLDGRQYVGVHRITQNDLKRDTFLNFVSGYKKTCKSCLCCFNDFKNIKKKISVGYVYAEKKVIFISSVLIIMSRLYVCVCAGMSVYE